MKRIVVFLGVIALLGASGYWFYTQNKTATSATAPQSEVDTLVQKLDSEIELPQETPTLADVTDISQLSDQHFFDRALNGDKVLIYLQSGRAVLFRPSSNKIIEVGPVQLVDVCTKDPKATGCKKK